MRFWDTPILYTPWLAFPVKQERSSGLLVPEFGFSSRDGVEVKLPFFVVLDGSRDLTVTPFTKTDTRHGLELDYREVFSQKSAIDGKIIYSNETPRDGELRGTDITGVSDPDIDDNRVGVYLQQAWKNEPGASVPISLVSDIHHVSDNLFLREIDDSLIGDSTDRFATSRVALRAGFSDYVSASLIGEYNQSLISPQETTFQRLPELNLNAQRSFRPFGFNPYGLKVTPSLQIQAVHFDRETGFDGLRYNIAPSVKIPFHYKNYFNSELNVEFDQTYYELDDQLDPSTSVDLEGSNDRDIFRASYRIGTAVEKIFTVADDSVLKTITSLGSRNQTHSLKRIKHTIEPNLTFAYIPEEEQNDNPFFDSFDRIRERELVTYEVVSRLIGSFDYKQGGASDIEEFVEAPGEFAQIDTLSPLTDFDSSTGLDSDLYGSPEKYVRSDKRELRDLARVRLVQSYDFLEDREDNDPERDAFSDLGLQFSLTPTRDFGFAFGTNYDVEDSDVSSWNIATHLYDDRGDRFRARYTFIDNNISQLEGNIEIPLSSRLKLGYYARYDELESEFIEQQAALRISSACDCWHFDIGFTDRINPDRERVLFKFTLQGLGDITQNFGFSERETGETIS